MDHYFLLLSIQILLTSLLYARSFRFLDPKLAMLISREESFALGHWCQCEVPNIQVLVSTLVWRRSGACQSLLLRERFLHRRFALFFFIVLRGLRISSLNHRPMATLTGCPVKALAVQSIALDFVFDKALI